jgi:hypothetical protein
MFGKNSHQVISSLHQGGSKAGKGKSYFSIEDTTDELEKVQPRADNFNIPFERFLIFGVSRSGRC